MPRFMLQGPHKGAFFFVLRSFTMHELRNQLQHVRFCWLFLDCYGVKTIVFCVRSRPKKTENKNIQQITLSSFKTIPLY